MYTDNKAKEVTLVRRQHDQIERMYTDNKAKEVTLADYIKAEGLAGAMLWTMTNDDFNNHCGQGAWPLLTTLRDLLPDNV
ncbi:hypothetical protein ACOMHN_009500 [Nucella lapillus]